MIFSFLNFSIRSDLETGQSLIFFTLSSKSPCWGISLSSSDSIGVLTVKELVRTQLLGLNSDSLFATTNRARSIIDLCAPALPGNTKFAACCEFTLLLVHLLFLRNSRESNSWTLLWV